MSLRVWEPPAHAVNAPLGSVLLPVTGGATVTVTIEPTAMRLTAGAREDSVVLPLPLTSPSLLTSPLVLSLAWFDDQDVVVAEQAIEVRVFESQHLIEQIEALAARTQASGDPCPMMSIARYYAPLHSWVPHLAGARVLISGCGSGGELLAVMALGARGATGVEMEGAELDIARALCRHLPHANVLAYAAGLPGVPVSDVVLSRHVIEHVPFAQRKAYLAELLQKLRPGGRLLLEAPNQDCPIEVHTGMRFFHWLDARQQSDAIRYFEARAAALPDFERERFLLSSIRGHRNARVSEIEADLEGLGVIEERTWLDSTFAIPDSAKESGDTLRLVIRRL